MTTTSLAHQSTEASRELRALELYRKHGRDIQALGEDLYSVPSCTGRGVYTVDYNVEVCDCPDFQYRGQNCKHILAVGIYVAKRRPHACTGGWVYIGYTDEYGEEREASYRCRRCEGEVS